ncbi:MAG TPA: ECF-type sigma factor [Candidatus Angelobacter sp.]|nr:ECF-type sigma factor [Candidatus Angelobacter sp.]
MNSPIGEITRLLDRLAEGDQNALEELFSLVSNDLRRIAAAQMRNEGGDHMLQPTALVNEFYLRLVKQRRIALRDRSAFFGVASKVMRRVLVEYARNHGAKKRGAGYERVLLEEAALLLGGKPQEILAVDEALTELEKADPLQASIVELRFFGGLTTREIAESLRMTPEAVEKEWNFAKAWLHHELKTDNGDTSRSTRKS